MSLIDSLPPPILNASGDVGVAISRRGQLATFGTEGTFLAYSLTKSVLASLSLRLTGLEALDDPLATWLPHAPHADRMTLRQILNHTSGLPDYGPLPRYHQAVQSTPSQPWSPDDFLALADPLLFEPGSNWAYSNIGYMLIKLLIEKTSNRPFSDVITSTYPHLRVVTQIHDLSELVPTTSPYLGGKDPRQAYHPGWVAHGLVATSPIDMVRFMDGLKTEPHLLADVRVPFSHPIFVSPSYGLGLMTDPHSPWGHTFGHSGEGPGYSAAAFYFPADDTAIAVFSTQEGGDAEKRLFAIRNWLAVD